MKSNHAALVMLGLSLMVFLMAGCVNSGKMKQLQSENTRLNQLIQQKDTQIKILTDQSQARQKELANVTSELDRVKKELEATKSAALNLTQPSGNAPSAEQAGIAQPTNNTLNKK